MATREGEMDSHTHLFQNLILRHNVCNQLIGLLRWLLALLLARGYGLLEDVRKEQQVLEPELGRAIVLALQQRVT